ncbi:PqqD family protein [Subtercola vilae]|uniref:PqqD family protein n=1 Tax=Subtercola vilae TaxID=2056433 RepID=UPI001375761C|nr:PqqD family protein [Subtercola vilae]
MAETPRDETVFLLAMDNALCVPVALAGSAAAIWQLIPTMGTTLTHIAEVLSSESGVATVEITAHLRDFVTSLASQGLVLFDAVD